MYFRGQAVPRQPQDIKGAPDAVRGIRQVARRDLRCEVCGRSVSASSMKLRILWAAAGYNMLNETPRHDTPAQTLQERTERHLFSLYIPLNGGKRNHMCAATVYVPGIRSCPKV